MLSRHTLTLAALVVVGTYSANGIAVAQQRSIKDQLVGTWILVESTRTDPDGSKADSWGSNPLGTYMFDNSGHFVQMLLRSDLPKIASRTKGTPEENKAVVAGSIAMYGTYTVNESEKTINVQITGSTFARFNGASGKRTIASISADELKLTNPGTSTGARADSVWRRAK
jgi:hypothetical protein